MKKFLFGLLMTIGCLTILGCDIDFVTDTVYTPVFYEAPMYPAYYVEPCCYDYVVIYY